MYNLNPGIATATSLQQAESALATDTAKAAVNAQLQTAQQTQDHTTKFATACTATQQTPDCKRPIAHARSQHLKQGNAHPYCLPLQQQKYSVQLLRSNKC